jgi:4-aminobutyrate aminotransferase-like enzyme
LQDIVVQKGLGSWIWDTKGNKYLDMTAGAVVQLQQQTSRACLDAGA